MQVGDKAPEFTLSAANEGDGWNVGERIALPHLLARGPAIVEFLRGTW